VNCDPKNTGLKDMAAAKGLVLRTKFQSVVLSKYLDDPKVNKRIGAIKMDVEGFEPFVVNGIFRSCLLFSLNRISPTFYTPLHYYAPNTSTLT
jgi:hypothetical protein